MSYDFETNDMTMRSYTVPREVKKKKRKKKKRRGQRKNKHGCWKQLAHVAEDLLCCHCVRTLKRPRF